MSQVLFTHSYFLRFDPKQWKMHQPYPPLGTLYAAAVLREAGHDVALFDTMLAKGPEGIAPHLRSQTAYLVIYDDGFNYLTKMCLTNMREAALDMALKAREQGIPVICCSSDSTDHHRHYLENGADYVILGEGEETLKALIGHLDSGEGKTRDIKGLAYLEEGQLVSTPPRPVMHDLDALPAPAWDLVAMDDYRSAWMEGNGYFALNYATTRGCPFKCNWCAKPIYGNRYHSHSPERVARELAGLQQATGFDYIWFCDDIFGLKPGWVQEFAHHCRQLDLQFRFKIQSRADLLLKENTVEALAQAGADEVWIGAESGSQRILDAMDKGITVEQVHEATKLMKQYGIKPCFFLQFGYLGETQADIDATLDMLLELMPHDIGVSVSYPLPGTIFYDKVKDDLKDKANWTDSDELALMFRNNYSPEYYKKLQRHVHKRFRRKQGLQTMKQLMKLNTPFSPSNLRSALLTIYYEGALFFDQYQLARLQKNP